MVINTNVEAEATTQNLNISQSNLAKSLSRLSSGRKIIQPADDAAGLAVSNRLEAQIKRLDSARSNVSNAISWAQTQDGYMQNISSAFRRMSELAMLAQDSTKSDADRNLYDKEFQTLKTFVSDTTTQDYNGVSMFAGVSLDVTIDSEGTTFAMASLDLETNTYTNVLNAGTDSWTINTAGNYATKVKGATLNQASHKISMDGYTLNTAANKLSIDATKLSADAIKLGAGGNHHYDVSTDTWSASAGANTIEYKADSLIKVDGTTIKSLDGAKAVTDALPSGTNVTTIEVQSGSKLLSEAGHGLVDGAEVKLTNVAAGESAYNTSTVYYVKNAVNDTQTTGVTGDGAAAAHGKMTKAGHGMADGAKVRIAGGLHVGETTYDQTTDYYVKNATAAYDVTGITVNNALSSATTLTKTGHTLKTGDKIEITDTMVGVVTSADNIATGTSYFVRKTGTDTFELYDTHANAKDTTGTTGIRDFGDGLGDELLCATKTNGGSLLTLANHGLQDNDIVKGSGESPADGVFDAAGGTDYHVKVLSDNTFELYTNADLATGKVTFDIDGDVDLKPKVDHNVALQVQATGTVGTDFYLYEDSALTCLVGDFSAAPAGSLTLTQIGTGTGGVNGTDFTLHTTKADALAGTGAVNFTAHHNATELRTVENKLTVTGHNFSNGDKVRFSHAGTIPTGTAALNATTDYFVNAVDLNTVKLYDSSANAIAGGTTGLISINGDGSGAKLYKMDSANWTHHSSGDWVKTGASTDTNLAASDYTRYSANDFTTSAIAGSDGVTSTAYASGEFVATNAAGGAGSGGDLTAANVSSVAKNDFVSVTGNIATEDASAVAYGSGAFISGYTTSTAMNLSASQVTERAKGAILSTSQYNNAVTRGALTSLQVDSLAAGSIVNTSQDLTIGSVGTKNSADYANTNVVSVNGAKIALELVRAAITKVATDRASLGASQTRLNFSEYQLSVTKQNLSAALSRIADVDVAEEATHYARYQILVATGTQMLKQANQLPQGAVELLR